MMKKQLNWVRQLANSGAGRTQEMSDLLSDELILVEQRVEPAKRASHNIHKRLLACLQGQQGSDMEKRMDEYSADLYHFASKEDNYANYFISLLEIEAEYHRTSLQVLDSALSEIKENHSPREFAPFEPSAGVYGVDLQKHLEVCERQIALPIEACVMMLLSKGINEEGLFRLAAAASVLKKLKQSLNCGKVDPKELYSDPHAVAGALKSYLRELPQPLMTFDLYNDWMQVASMKDPDEKLQKLQELTRKLPTENYENLRYLVKFLAKLAEGQSVNKMSPSNIAIVLGPNLLWPQDEGECSLMDMASASSIQAVAVIEPLIQNADLIFPEDLEFNVSGMFLPPETGNADEENVNGVTVSAQKPPVKSTPESAFPGDEVLKETAVCGGDVKPVSGGDDGSTDFQPVTTEPSQTPVPSTALLGDTKSAQKKVKRPAPIRPTVPPPPIHPRSQPTAPPARCNSTEAQPIRKGPGSKKNQAGPVTTATFCPPRASRPQSGKSLPSPIAKLTSMAFLDRKELVPSSPHLPSNQSSEPSGEQFAAKDTASAKPPVRSLSQPVPRPRSRFSSEN
nr:PREDICTED: SH3 domain-binding protein 1 [Latimeria chalumnae]|eukprot:XP_014352924.1 PREDICTED: SH3 domain-binding protein 1 [Latimeria chalumnae]